MAKRSIKLAKTEIGCGFGCLGILITFAAISIVTSWITSFDFDSGKIWRAFILTVILGLVAFAFLSYINSFISSKLSNKLGGGLTVLLSAISGCIVCLVGWVMISDVLVIINIKAKPAIFNPFISGYIQELKTGINKAIQSGPIPGPVVIIDLDKLIIHPAHRKIPKALAAHTPEEVVTLVGVQSSWVRVGTYNARRVGEKWVSGSSPALRRKYNLIIVDRLPNRIVNTVKNHYGPMPDWYLKENLLTGDRYEIVRNKKGDILGVACEDPNPYYWLVTEVKRLCNYSSINPLPFRWRTE